MCEEGQIVEVALNTHGTRAVQKLIETLASREQRALVISALGPGVVSLIKDLNGNHVVQRCLQRLGPDDSQFVYDAASRHCVEIATHRHGCCVLQRCIDFATPQQKTALINEIAANALSLSQVCAPCLPLMPTHPPWDCTCFAPPSAICIGMAGCCPPPLPPHPTYTTTTTTTTHACSCPASGSPIQDAFGNYVVQYVLELGQMESSRAIMIRLVGHFAELSIQKFSSNVVEKCLKLGGLTEERHGVVRELVASPLLPRLLQDSYGNYVVQSALAISSGQLHTDLVEAIRPYLSSLRGTPHGKRILQRVNGKA